MLCSPCKYGRRSVANIYSPSLVQVPTTLYAAGGIHQELALKIDRHIWDFPKENTVASFKSA